MPQIDLLAQAARSFRAIETGDLRDIEDFIAPTWRNREAAVEPPAARAGR